MPIFEIHSLDVWGNAAEGFTINDQFRAGEVYIRPSGEIGQMDLIHPYDRRVVAALIENGALNAGAMEEFEAGRLNLEHGEGTIEISETDHEYGITGGNETRWLDVNGTLREVQAYAEEEGMLEEGEEVEVIEDERPLLMLEEAVPTDGLKEFWRTTLNAYPTGLPMLIREVAAEFSIRLWQHLTPVQMAQVQERNEAEESDAVCHSHDFCDANLPMAEAFEAVTNHVPHDEADNALWNDAWGLAKEQDFEVPLQVVLSYGDNRIGTEVTASTNSSQVADRFEWGIRDWERQRYTLGFDPVSGNEIRLDKREVGEALVALDGIMGGRRE